MTQHMITHFQTETEGSGIRVYTYYPSCASMYLILFSILFCCVLVCLLKAGSSPLRLLKLFYTHSTLQPAVR